MTRDGVKVATSPFNRIADVLSWAIENGRPVPHSLAQLDADAISTLHSLWYHERHSPRIPVRLREPRAAGGLTPGAATMRWLREAVKWQLGTLLTAGMLTWSTLHRRCGELMRFDRWLATLPDPAAVAHEPGRAAGFATSYRTWTSDPATRKPGIARVPARRTNNDLRAVVELMAFLVDHRESAAGTLGSSPWDQLTEAHPALWQRQPIHVGAQPQLIDDSHYVDDHALAQITASLPAIGTPTMRMILLQILTGRRAAEILLCDFDCLSPATPGALEAVGDSQVTRFHYGQSKIDQAPDPILVDAEVVAVIEEQRAWVRGHYPGATPRYLFQRLTSNPHATRPYSEATYRKLLRRFGELAQVTDGAGRTVYLSHTHRFRQGASCACGECALRQAHGYREARWGI